MKTKRLLPAPRNLGVACLLALSVLAGTGLAQASGYLFRTPIPNAVAAAAPCSGSFTQDSPGTYSVTVPAGCPVSVTLNGAGGGGAMGTGGDGGQVTGTLPAASTSQTYTVVLQAGGSPASTSDYSAWASGGGYAALYSASGTLIAVAGGGGGAGNSGGGAGAYTDNGGNAGEAGVTSPENPNAACTTTATNGQGATDTGPVAGGASVSQCNAGPGNSGSGMVGGAGLPGDAGNGGGGGGGNGYFGGGGGSDGGNYYPGGGGGGGSNYASAALSDASLSDANGGQGGAGYPNTPTAGANASATLSW
ncbi:hypothetical protein A5904_03375 [Acidithiobacillus caldus]|uniref:hypothetical protein n=1 Tax=Acidithiobacillus caldus TaxID=33059 RepID=UPI0007D9379E|nr:hypothetical protein [Acidithiobacillus caldus]AUW32143.1 hypothetical protein A5904_03375 [Acidithiobacillus caldus]QER45666.1 hypothetical protein F0726_02614 [Acidithiobacillus caldus]